MPALDALQNAARLKASPMQSNFGQYDEVFAPAGGGHAPAAWEQFSGHQNADNAATALGGGPAIQALRHAADAQRLGDIDDQLGAEADLSSGRPQHIAGMQAEMGADLADFTSERGAARSFLPNATDAQYRDTESAQDLAQTRYVDPAVYKAQGDEQAARIGASGRVGAVQARNQGDGLRGLYNALNTIMSANGGKPPTPEQVAQLKASFGLQ